MSMNNANAEQLLLFLSNKSLADEYVPETLVIILSSKRVEY